MHHPTDRIAHTTAFVIPVVEHWLEREIALITRMQPNKATVKQGVYTHFTNTGAHVRRAALSWKYIMAGGFSYFENRWGWL